MNPPRYALLLLTFSLSFLSHFTSLAQTTSTTQGWTVADEKELYDVLYDSAKQLLKEDAQCKEWAACAITKIKTVLPKGIGSVPPDSVSRLAAQVGQSCIKTLKNPVYVWSPVMTATLRQQAMANAALQRYTEAMKKQLADCMITKFQQRYPEGFTAEQMQAEPAKLISDCMEEITAKKP